MRGMSKADTLDLLEVHGMNTVDRVVLKKPFKPKTLLESITTITHPKISMRTWERGRVLCPFYPNQSADDLIQVVGRDWPKIKLVDGIILSEGINPDDSKMAGKIMDGETDLIVEYFEGPGTVRKLDTITPLTKRFPKKGVILTTPFNDWASLYVAAKAFFRSYPSTIIEWSYYPYKVGKKQENYIYWEVL
jgi:hypothetical protein